MTQPDARPMTEQEWRTVETHPELPIVTDAMGLARRLSDRVAAAFVAEDMDTVKWIWKQLVSVERRAQERET